MYYLPSGIDLRLMEGEDFRRTELFKEGPTVQKRASEWLRGKEPTSLPNRVKYGSRATKYPLGPTCQHWADAGEP
jgi:hypothetical protein